MAISVLVGSTPITPVPTDNLTTPDAAKFLSANQGVTLKAATDAEVTRAMSAETTLNNADIDTVAIVGTDLVVTLKGGSTKSVDITSLLADVKLATLVYNGTTKALDGTMSDGATFSVPVSDLFQLAATAIPPAADGATGAVGTSNAYAREDHKHAAQGISLAALNHLDVGPDGLHYFSLDATKIGVPAVGNYVLGYANGVLTAFPI